MPALPPPVDLDDLLGPFSLREIELGLDRLRAALAAGGHPERRFEAVQVAGTNGKGSISTFLHSILRAAGLRAAAYRSPHLVSWCERIQLDDAWIQPELLRADLIRWRPLAQAHGLTPFELLTAAAFERFAIEAPDLVVLEVGLGGRLDATTVHPQRPVIGFGAIGLDHREFLGDSVALITAEKAAVLGPGAVAISAPQLPEAAAVLTAEARRRGAELRWVEPLAPPASGGPALGLPGMLQRANGAVAVAMARALAERPGATGERLALALAGGAAERGLAAARWPGRLQRARWRGLPLLLDGAHNPPAAAALRVELEALDPRPRRWLVGIQAHKQGPELLALLLRPADRVLVCPVAGARSWSAEALAAALPPPLAAGLAAAASAAEGLERLLAGSAPDQALPVVCGSLHLLGEILPLLDG
ncbi:MAG: bifunctional folylpolyglutamate synthase/dihydrofolate synthase [Cyanobacteriota bacterium]|nr:bifunctional folylpolyglutamate synthase/dihydrofolate synthase [Cyanobacteriota bacterium]